MSKLQVVSLIAGLSLSPAFTYAATYFDDFESSTATPDTWAQQNALAVGSRSDANPAGTTYGVDSATAGQWFHFDGSSLANYRHDIQVTSNAAPGAYAGSNYLRVHRSVGANSAVIAKAFTAWDEGLTSGQVHAQWRMYVPNVGDSFVGGVYMVEHLDNDHSVGTSGTSAALFFQGDGDVRISEGEFANNFFINSPEGTPGQWQLWEMDADLDANTWTLTINGTQSATFNFNYANAGIVGLAFNGQEGQEYYIDDVELTVVPEPAALGLIAPIASLAASRRRRNRR